MIDIHNTGRELPLYKRHVAMRLNGKTQKRQNLMFKFERAVWENAYAKSSYDWASWKLMRLDNGTWYIRPRGHFTNAYYWLSPESGYLIELSADAFGITSTLEIMSRWRWNLDPHISKSMREAYQMLRYHALTHPEGTSIFNAHQETLYE